MRGASDEGRKLESRWEGEREESKKKNGPEGSHRRRSVGHECCERKDNARLGIVNTCCGEKVIGAGRARSGRWRVMVRGSSFL